MAHMFWQKSSFSASTTGNECVEVASAGGSIKIRESDDPGLVVTTGPGPLRELLTAVKNGEFESQKPKR